MGSISILRRPQVLGLGQEDDDIYAQNSDALFRAYTQYKVKVLLLITLSVL